MLHEHIASLCSWQWRISWLTWFVERSVDVCAYLFCWEDNGRGELMATPVLKLMYMKMSEKQSFCLLFVVWLWLFSRVPQLSSLVLIYQLWRKFNDSIKSLIDIIWVNYSKDVICYSKRIWFSNCTICIYQLLCVWFRSYTSLSSCLRCREMCSMEWDYWFPLV